MESIKVIAEGLNVAPIYWRILQHPELWNQYTQRTEHPDSPHYGLDDIWARFGPPESSTDPGPHDSVWYPAADVLGLKEFCLDIMHAVGGVELGGVLLTRIKPGKICKPHEDHGWHAYRYDKFLVQIASAPGQSFNFPGISVETKPGDLAWFENQTEHWVINNSEYERVSMVVCIRIEKPKG